MAPPRRRPIALPTTTPPTGSRRICAVGPRRHDVCRPLSSGPGRARRCRTEPCGCRTSPRRTASASRLVRPDPDADEIEFLRRHSVDRRSILGVLARREHLRGVYDQAHSASRRPGPRSLQLLRKRLRNEHLARPDGAPVCDNPPVHADTTGRTHPASNALPHAARAAQKIAPVLVDARPKPDGSGRASASGKISLGNRVVAECTQTAAPRHPPSFGSLTEFVPTPFPAR